MNSKRTRTRVPKRVQNLRSGKYKFSVKTHPLEGIISFVMGIAALLVLIISCYMAWQSRGNMGEVTGLVNVFAFLTTIIGIIFAVLAFRKRDIHVLFPALGFGMNGLLTIVYLVTYITGTLL